MSENIADFLNQNAGVIGAASNRNIAATNQSICALRDELGKLNKQFEQDQEKQERERLNRDILFQFSKRVEAISSAPASPEMYFELVRVSEDFRQLGFDSGTFNSLQDKNFFSEVSSSIDQSFAVMWESFPNELKEQVAEVADWNSLEDMGEAIAVADEKIPYIKAALSDALEKGEVLRKKKPSVFSSLIWNLFMFGPLLLAVPAFIWHIKEVQYYTEAQDYLVKSHHYDALKLSLATMLLSPVVAFVVWIVRVITVDHQIKRHSDESSTSDILTSNLRGQLSFLVSIRAVFAQRLNELQRIPADTINFFASETVTPQERFIQLDQVSAYVADICSRIGLDAQSLPTAPERRQKGDLLMRGT